VGRIPVSFEADPDGGEVAWFRAPPAELGACCEPDTIARALGIAPGDIADFPPVQRVAAGTAAMIVPLRGLDALRRASLDLNHYAELLERGFPPLTYLFCGETRHPGNDLSARFFFEAHGVREDPATGNGAAFLGAYLLWHAPRPGAELSLRIEQGHELGRPSLVLLRAGQAGAVPDIRVGGRVFPILRGELG